MGGTTVASMGTASDTLHMSRYVATHCTLHLFGCTPISQLSVKVFGCPGRPDNRFVGHWH